MTQQNGPTKSWDRGLPTDMQSTSLPDGHVLLVFHVGTWGCSPGGGQTEKLDQPKTKRHAGDAPSNQPMVAGVFPQRSVVTLK